MAREVFFRFDDIGPLSRRSFQLIDLMEALSHPYILGVIPSALSWWMKRRLRDTRHAVVFQHGTTHKNRCGPQAPDEFPAELGNARTVAEMRRGRQILENALGVPITGYIPPWNRVSPLALQVLEDEGYQLLSADALHSTSLLQLPVHVDVYSCYRPVSVRSNEEIEADIAAHLQNAALVGVVLHPLSIPRTRGKQMEELLRSNAHRMISHLLSTTGSCQDE